MARQKVFGGSETKRVCCLNIFRLPFNDLSQGDSRETIKVLRWFNWSTIIVRIFVFGVVFARSKDLIAVITQLLKKTEGNYSGMDWRSFRSRPGNKRKRLSARWIRERRILEILFNSNFRFLRIEISGSHQARLIGGLGSWTDLKTSLEPTSLSRRLLKTCYFAIYLMGLLMEWIMIHKTLSYVI